MILILKKNKNFIPIIKNIKELTFGLCPNVSSFLTYTNQFKKPLNKKDDFCKLLISGSFGFAKTPAITLLSPRRPTGGAGCRYQLFNKLTKTCLDWYSP